MKRRINNLLLLTFIAIAGVTLTCACSGSNGATDKQDKKGKNKDKGGAGTAFTGGTFEASGVAHVPGTDGVLFVDDSRPGEVFWMKIDEAGQQVGEIKPIRLGTMVENPEGITSDGSYFYIVGSQANPKNGERNAIARFAFDHNTQTASPAGVIGNLRELLLSRVPDLKGAGEMKGNQGGLNIEGIAWDPDQKRLLLGLRSPIINGQAMVVPLKPADPGGAFSADNLRFEEAKPMMLALGGSGVRDIQYDSRLKSFLVISGAPENVEKGEFILWQWDGKSQPVQKSVLDQKVKPEGITAVNVGGQNFIYIVCDASRYLKLDYANLE
ncbi:MAG TPA: DUF3616 domain-containing protein [Blastocatellia bacterium]|nr:DUF3616 domain-containing protein [Blastocatellia bacterium]